MRGHRRGLLLSAALIIIAAAPGAAAAQSAPVYPPGAIVQPLETGPGAELRRNLSTLAENPHSVSALVGAGRAALDMGDPNAALSFFQRADETQPRDARIRAGIAVARARLGQGREALAAFAEAEALGAPESELAGDRGLAYDALGDPRRAQADYATALRYREDAEVRRRMALSLAISGQRDAALRMIDAQLRAHDRSAWRTQAFVLALTGDAQGAGRTAQTVMPPDAAAAMAPFFDRLAGLSPSQKAMAVHFGHFPSDGRATAYARNDVSADPGALAMAQGGPAAVPARPRIEIPEPVSDAPRRRPGVEDTRRPTRRTSGGEERPASLIRRPVETASAAPPPPPPPPPPASTAPVANDIAPGFILSQQPGSSYRPSPPPPPPPPPPPVPLPSFNSVAETVASLPEEPGAAPPVRFESRPSRAPETRPAATAASASTRARNTANPSRRWVQIAHASSATLLPREFAEARDDAPALLGSRSAYAARAGGTNRLLVGPFDSDAQVRAFIAQLDRRHVEAIAWTSPAGQEIERLRIPDEPRSSTSASGARSDRADSDRPASARSSRDTASRSGTGRTAASRSTDRNGRSDDDDRHATSRSTGHNGSGSRADSNTRSTTRSTTRSRGDSDDRPTSRSARSRSEPEPRTPARRRSTH